MKRNRLRDRPCATAAPRLQTRRSPRAGRRCRSWSSRPCSYRSSRSRRPTFTRPRSLAPRSPTRHCHRRGSRVLLLRLDVGDERAHVVGLVRQAQGRDRARHDPVLEPLHDLCVGVGDRVLEIGVVGRHGLAVVEGDLVPGDAVEGGARAASAAEGVAAGAAVAGKELLAVSDECLGRGNRSESGRLRQSGCRRRGGGRRWRSCRGRRRSGGRSAVFAAVVTDRVGSDQ
jgi:hypothetical protein